jgi:hypothetical protein
MRRLWITPSSIIVVFIIHDTLLDLVPYPMLHYQEVFDQNSFILCLVYETPEFGHEQKQLRSMSKLFKVAL